MTPLTFTDWYVNGSVFPFVVYDKDGVNDIISNINLIEDKVFSEGQSTAALQAGSSAIPTTWQVLLSYTLFNNLIPSIFTAQIPLSFNAAAGNFLEIGFYRNGTRIGWATQTTNVVLTTSVVMNLAFYVPSTGSGWSSGNETFELRSTMMLGAPAVTATMQGYHYTHYQI